MASYPLAANTPFAIPGTSGAGRYLIVNTTTDTGEGHDLYVTDSPNLDTRKALVVVAPGGSRRVTGSGQLYAWSAFIGSFTADGSFDAAGLAAQSAYVLSRTGERFLASRVLAAGVRLDQVRAYVSSKGQARIAAGLGFSFLVEGDSQQRGTNCANPQFGPWWSLLWDGLHLEYLGSRRATLGFVDLQHGDESGGSWPSANFLGVLTAVKNSRFWFRSAGWTLSIAGQNGATLKTLTRLAGAASATISINLDPTADARFGATDVYLCFDQAADGGSHTADSFDGGAYGSAGAIGGGSQTMTFSTVGSVAGSQVRLFQKLDPTIKRTIQIAPTTTAPSSAIGSLYVCNGDALGGFHVACLGKHGSVLNQYGPNAARLTSNIDAWGDGTTAFRYPLLFMENWATNDLLQWGTVGAAYATNQATVIARARALVSKPAYLKVWDLVFAAGTPSYDNNYFTALAQAQAAIDAAHTADQPCAILDLNLVMLGRPAGSSYTLAEARAAGQAQGLQEPDGHYSEWGQKWKAAVMSSFLRPVPTTA